MYVHFFAFDVCYWVIPSHGPLPRSTLSFDIRFICEFRTHIYVCAIFERKKETWRKKTAPKSAKYICMVKGPTNPTYGQSNLRIMKYQNVVQREWREEDNKIYGTRIQFFNRAILILQIYHLNNQRQRQRFLSEDKVR